MMMLNHTTMLRGINTTILHDFPCRLENLWILRPVPLSFSIASILKLLMSSRFQCSLAALHILASLLHVVSHRGKLGYNIWTPWSWFSLPFSYLHLTSNLSPFRTSQLSIWLSFICAYLFLFQSFILSRTILPDLQIWPNFFAVPTYQHNFFFIRSKNFF
jgi:hypothetical protein